MNVHSFEYKETPHNSRNVKEKALLSAEGKKFGSSVEKSRIKRC